MLAAGTFSHGICIAPAAVPSRGVMVVAHADTPSLSEATLQKIYLGKVVEVEGRPIVPVNLSRGNAVRQEFMAQILAQDHDKYVAYWTVRRYIGKGSPPREFDTVSDQLEFVRTTPGAIGYIDSAADIEPGLKILMKRP